MPEEAGEHQVEPRNLRVLLTGGVVQIAVRRVVGLRLQDASFGQQWERVEAVTDGPANGSPATSAGPTEE